MHSFIWHLRVIIKIESHPFYHIICDWFSRRWNKKKENWKKIPMDDSKKPESFNSSNYQYIFAKTSGIGPWVSRINWWEIHWLYSTYMDVRSKTGKKSVFRVGFLPVLCLILDDLIGWATLLPFNSIYPTHTKTNLRKNIENWQSWKSQVFFASSPWKLVTIYIVEWIGLNFYDYRGWQQKWPNPNINTSSVHCSVRTKKLIKIKVRNFSIFVLKCTFLSQLISSARA